MAIALVQNSATIAAGATNTLPVASTAGTLLVATLGGTPVTPPAGWSKAIDDASFQVSIYFYQNNPGGLSSFNFTNANELFIMEFSGVATSTALDTTGINTLGSSPATGTTSGNVSAANELAINMGGDGESKAGTTTMGGPAGWTAIKRV